MTTVAIHQHPARTMHWLLRREFWENKGSMFWAPAVLAALLVVLLGGAMAFGMAHHGPGTHIYIGSQEVPRGALAANLPATAKAMMADTMTGNYVVFTSPLLAILAGVSFFYCLGALYDERRDRSVLFWKSLPVSDTMTVLSKAAAALLLAPAIVLALITVSSLIVLAMLCLLLAVLGVNVFIQVLTSAGLYLSPLYLLALLPVYMVWALPTVGWLLLVSSWARTKPFLWAVMLPLTGLLVIKWISLALGTFGTVEHELMQVARGIVAQLLGGLVPGLWFAFDGARLPAGLEAVQHGSLLKDVVVTSWMSLASPYPWVGAACGAAMLAGAVRVRRWRDED